MRIFLHLCLGLLIAIIAPVAASAQDDSESATLTRHDLAPNLVVLSGAGGNSTILWGPDGTLVIDGKVREIYPVLRASIADLGAMPARYLLNSHWHGDHSGGNGDFARNGALVMAQENVRTRLEAAAADPENHLSPADLPIVTWQQGITLSLNGQRLLAIHIPHAHTDGDSIYWLQQANIIVMGDNFFNHVALPYADMESGGNVIGLLDAANAALSLANPQTRFVPGHGPIASYADMVRHRDQLAAVIDAVRTARAAGKTLAEVQALPIARLYPVNASFLSAGDFIASVYASIEQRAAATP